MKFHENPSSGNRVVSCELTDGQTNKESIFAILRIGRKIFCRLIIAFSVKSENRSFFCEFIESITTYFVVKTQGSFVL
jgi:hypothetical protein